MQEIPLAVGKRVSEEGQLPSPDKIIKMEKGVAVEIVHWFLDELWNAGSQQLNISPECKKILIKYADGTKPSVVENLKEEIDSDKLTLNSMKSNENKNINKNDSMHNLHYLLD